MQVDDSVGHGHPRKERGDEFWVRRRQTAVDNRWQWKIDGGLIIFSVCEIVVSSSHSDA